MKPVKPPRMDGVYKLPGGTEKNDLPFMREVKGMFIDHPIKGMTPVDKSGFHRVLDETGRVNEIPTLIDSAVISHWELDTDEIAALMSSNRIALTIHAEPIPPVSLGVVSPADANMDSSDWEPPIARSHLRRALDLLVMKLEEMGESPATAEQVMSGLDACLLETAAGRDGMHEETDFEEEVSDEDLRGGEDA